MSGTLNGAITAMGITLVSQMTSFYGALFRLSGICFYDVTSIDRCRTCRRESHSEELYNTSDRYKSVRARNTK